MDFQKTLYNNVRGQTVLDMVSDQLMSKPLNFLSGF